MKCSFPVDLHSQSLSKLQTLFRKGISSFAKTDANESKLDKFLSIHKVEM